MAGVRSARLLIGDRKRYRGWMARSVAGDLGCPYGCMDVNGRACEFTLEHVCLECEGAEIAAARGTWREQILALRCDMQKRTQHFQLEHVVDMLEAGKWKKSAQLDSDQWLRRVTGGLIRQSADDRIDRDPRTKARARAAVAAACELMQVACRAQADSEAQIREAVRVAGIQLKVVKKWRERVLWGGPLRVSRLAEIYEGRGRAQHMLARLAREGGLDGVQLRAALQRLQNKVASLSGMVRAGTSPARSQAALEGDAEARAQVLREWMLAHLVRRWRVRRAEAHGAGQRQGENFVASLITNSAARPSSWCSLPYAPTRRETYWIAPNARIAGLDECRARAWSAVLNLGGLTALRRLVRRASREGERANLVEKQMAKRMREWLDSGEGDGDAGLRPVPSREGAVHIVIGKPSARTAKRQRVAAARAAAMRPLHLGLEGDRCGRWAVDELLDGRMVGRARHVQVKWRGADSDGEPWPVCWVRWTALTKDLKQQAESFFPEREQAAGRGKTRAPPRTGSRRSVRVADREARAVGHGAGGERFRSRSRASDSSEEETDAACDSSGEADVGRKALGQREQLRRAADKSMSGGTTAAAVNADKPAIRQTAADDGRLHKVDKLIRAVRRQGRVKVQVRWQNARTPEERSISWVPIGYLTEDLKRHAWAMMSVNAARSGSRRSSRIKQKSGQNSADVNARCQKQPSREPLHRSCKRQRVCYDENARQADLS